MGNEQKTAHTQLVAYDKLLNRDCVAKNPSFVFVGWEIVA